MCWVKAAVRGCVALLLPRRPSTLSSAHPAASCPAGGEDAPLDYFAAQQVLAKLTETAEKGFLGGLKGAAGSWDKVVRAYEYNRECL